MSVFKNLESSDVFYTSYVANKQYDLSGPDALSSSGVVIETCSTGSEKYSSIKHMFYEGSLTDILRQDPFSTGSLFSGSFADTYMQSPVFISGSRNLGESIMVLSIPRDLIGDEIKKESISLSNNNGNTFVDREGVLYSGSVIVGDVIYDKGIVIVTDVQAVDTVERLSFSSTVPVSICNVLCSVEDREFNNTYNWTADIEELQQNKYFTPYITSIGLYNSQNELLAVAKLSKPLKKASNIDMTFRLHIDMF